MTDKQLIKQEIERRFNDNMKASEQYTENSKSRALFTSAAKEDYDLLAFIDSLPEEPTKEDLEEEIDRYYSDWQFDDDTIYEDMRDICRHFAEWGRNHIEDKSEMVSEDLEEEINNYIKDNFFGSGSMGFFSNRTKQELNSVDVANIARYFAEWQKKKNQESSCETEANCTQENDDLEEEITKCYKSRTDLMMTRNQFGELIHRFTELQKQQMMKDAVEAIVYKGLYSKYVKERDDESLRKALEKYNIGDKVKIIIVKEEQ